MHEEKRHEFITALILSLNAAEFNDEDLVLL